MSAVSQTLFSNTKISFTTITRRFIPIQETRILSLKNFSHFDILRSPSSNPKIITSFRTNPFPIKSFNTEYDMHGDRHNYIVNEFNLDAFLSILEFMCLGSSAIVSIGFAVNSMVLGTRKVLDVWFVNRLLSWQVVVLVLGLVIGVWIRRRQWSRICREDKRGVESVNLVGRIEKLEEDLRYSAGMIHALSRQLEKLGIRFRVTRKSLKEPIAEAAALAQKNSEATRALAAHGDILEKELGEIQKVLLAMQEQQQKQIELILAIAKAGKLFDTQQQPKKNANAIDPQSSVKKNAIPLVETVVGHQQVPKVGI